MDEARVVINLKDGIIELQGPVDFVRHYLDTYQPAIKGLQSLPKEAAVSPEKAKALPRKRKAAPAAKAEKGERISCTGAIRSDLGAGFFNEPRSTGEVKQRLSETGFTFTDSNVRNSLRRLAKSGVLGTSGRGTSLRYQRAKQS
jgi:hypothetical protein